MIIMTFEQSLVLSGDSNDDKPGPRLRSCFGCHRCRGRWAALEIGTWQSKTSPTFNISGDYQNKNHQTRSFPLDATTAGWRMPNGVDKFYN